MIKDIDVKNAVINWITPLYKDNEDYLDNDDNLIVFISANFGEDVKYPAVIVDIVNKKQITSRGNGLASMDLVTGERVIYYYWDYQIALSAYSEVDEESSDLIQYIISAIREAGTKPSSTVVTITNFYDQMQPIPPVEVNRKGAKKLWQTKCAISIRVREIITIEGDLPSLTLLDE